MTELSLIAKATVILALSVSVAAALRHARASVRALILATAFGALLVIPIAAIVIPPVTVTIPVLPAATRALQPSVRSALPPSSVGRTRVGDSAEPSSWRLPALSVSSVLRAVWMAGVIAFLLPLASTVWRLRAVRRTGLPVSDKSRTAQAIAAEAGTRLKIAVLASEEVTVPVTCGVYSAPSS